MEQEFIITSTNNIEGGVISKYYGVLNNNVVLGTNLFSDIGASFFDIFGGASSSYQKKLKEIYETSTRNLETKARNLGANAILSLSIDFDEISGGNKSMFMISVSGTAVYVEHSTNKKNDDLELNKSITNDDLIHELNKNIIIDKVQNGLSLNQDEWYFIQKNPIIKISEEILINFSKKELRNSADSDEEKKLTNNVSNYFRALDHKVSINILYDNLTKRPNQVFKLIQGNNFFSPERVLLLIEEGEIEIAVLSLGINKEKYSINDLSLMRKISKSLENLEDTGKIQASKNLLGKEKEKYICQNGHSNPVEQEFCLDYNCKINIKGLTKNQVQKINNFKNKVDTLNSLFKQN